MDLAHEADLDRMIGLIRDDCRFFGMEEDRIGSLVRDVLVKGHDNNDYSFEYLDSTGYTLTFWERGRCNWGISSFDGLEFRYLFQRHIVLHNFMDPEETARFLSRAKTRFGPWVNGNRPRPLKKSESKKQPKTISVHPESPQFL